MKGNNRTKAAEWMRRRVLQRLASHLAAGCVNRIVMAGSSVPAPPGAHNPERPRIFILTRGCRHVQIARRGRIEDVHLRRGDLLFCPANSWHLVVPDSHYVLLSILFDRSYTSLNWKADHGTLLHHYTAPPHLSPASRHTLMALDQTDPDAYDAVATFDLVKALIRLVHADLQRLGFLPNRALATYHQIHDYVEENFREPINRESVATEFGLHPNHVSRLFRELAGETFSATLTRIRLDCAARMLQESHYSVKEIACRCGYESANYFGKVFRKERGFSPGEFRAQPDGRGSG